MLPTAAVARAFRLATLLAVDLMTAPSTYAAPVPFTLTSVGGFNAPEPLSAIGLSLTATLQGLRYSSLTATDANAFFRGTTETGPLDVVLGTVTLNTAAANYTGNTLALAVLFYTPLNVERGTSPVFSATLNGTVSPTGGSVLFDFPDTPRVLFFQGDGMPGGAGRFALRINDLVVPANGSGLLTGVVTDLVTVPEPATRLLAGLGLAGAVTMRRQRRGVCQ